jgi:DNA-directed RNA polymerase specialized sigma subunit
LAELRSDHARARAMDLLAMADPLANDEESRRLRELAIRYLEVAQQLEAEEDGSAEPSETISAALDAVARDYFSHMLRRTTSNQEDLNQQDSDQEDKWDGG